MISCFTSFFPLVFTAALRLSTYQCSTMGNVVFPHEIKTNLIDLVE